MHAGSVAVCAIVSTVSCGGRLFYCSLGKPSHTFASGPVPSGFRYFSSNVSLLGSPHRGDGPGQGTPLQGCPPLGLQFSSAVGAILAACSGGCCRIGARLWLLAASLQARKGCFNLLCHFKALMEVSHILFCCHHRQLAPTFC